MLFRRVVKSSVARALLGVVIGYCSSPISAAEKPHQSPYLVRDYPTQVFWGDTHLHTNLSVDAFALGMGLTPDDAYHFARGKVVTGPGRVPMRIRRPLDFLVVADHAENLGLLAALEAGDANLLATESGRRWWEKLQKALPAIRALRESRHQDPELSQAVRPVHAAVAEGAEVVGNEAFRRSIWEGVARRADRYNDPGKFTAFVGYEWSPVERYIHRVVVFRDGATMAGTSLPFSALENSRPEDLWAALDAYSRKTGGQVLAIPHNPNFSKGQMFMLEDSSGRPFTRQYAETRSRWEPLLEVTQIKGDSETHPQLAPNDEFADYERYRRYDQKDEQAVARQRQYEYARSALKLGLDRQAALGVNPFKFGLIGGTDSHSALSEVDSSNYWALIPFAASTVANNKVYTDMNVAGFAAVWALENTRAALFDAMKRREVYATTGSRIELRFFGGWSYEQDDALRPDLARIGYAKGVPMGGDLTHPPEGGVARFLIRAVKDPQGANLDRVQVIKGWRSAQGQLHERIYNVAFADNRREIEGGSAPPVGSTVDVPSASYSNAIGDPELATVWQDPDFKADELAFYYVRVIEIPTPRWTAYYARDLAVSRMPPGTPMVAQQRAYSSPIWYTP